MDAQQTAAFSHSSVKAFLKHLEALFTLPTSTHHIKAAKIWQQLCWNPSHILIEDLGYTNVKTIIKKCVSEGTTQGKSTMTARNNKKKTLKCSLMLTICTVHQRFFVASQNKQQLKRSCGAFGS